jgi:hypothetical protein
VATQNSNQAAMIAKAYGSAMRATTADPSMFFDAARSGGMVEGTGGGMGGGGLGNRAVTGQQGPGYA